MPFPLVRLPGDSLRSVSTGDVLPLPLAEAVIYLMAFLELADDDTVDPDSAVTALENANADLLRLTRSQREALVAHAERLADQETRPRTIEFLRRFAEDCGLLEDEEE